MFKIKSLFNYVISILFIFCVLNSLSIYAKTSKQLLPVSVQLWSVKDALKADFDGTLSSIADMGFQGVEFAGDFGPYKNNPSALQDKLAKLNLVASSAHIGFDSLTDDTLADTLLFYKTLGVSILFVPWDERAWQPQGINSLTEQLTQVNEIAQRYAMHIGFHNHNKEFNQFQNATYWDAIASNTPYTLPLQLDIGWVHYAGKDPEYFIKKYPGRTLATHLKVRTHPNDGLSPILGENDYPWQKIIETLIVDGATQWLVVEQEEYPNGLTPMQSVAKSKVNLDKILAKMGE